MSKLPPQIVHSTKYTVQKVVQFFFVALLLITYYLLLPPSAAGQVPPPTVPCNQTRDPEFHSLRPYQASPCDPSVHETVLACGNDLVAVEKFTKFPSEGVCRREENNLSCEFKVAGSVNVAVSLPNSQLPILGNTELVPNSQSTSSQFDNAERVNEYVSWYLNGVTAVAEETPQDKLVDFAGPLKKLLPFRVQRDEKEKTIVNTQANNQHDQVIGCINVLGQITACYPERVGVRSVRLSELKDHLPPKEEDYKNSTDYYIALREWQGDSCTKIAGAPICVYVPPKPKYWAQLFKYIPLSSMEDRKGETSAAVTSSQTSSGVDLTDVKFVPTKTNSTLYFAHTEEAGWLASILQKTFSPQGEEGFSGDTEKQSAFYTNNCEAFDVRTNMGDNLFGNLASQTPISGTLSYKATFKCDFGLGATPAACTKEVPVAVSIFTKTPKANEIWERLVNGSQGIVKRFFPYELIQGIKDLPAVTFATYNSSADKTLAGDPVKERPGTQAGIYIPHMGGVYEYFLKGIQTALRPKGFGSPVIAGVSGPVISNCSEGTGYCSVANLLPYFGNTADAQKASIICQAESASNPFALNKGCLTQKSFDYSVGLFQYNLASSLNRCPGAFSAVDQVKKTCVVADASKLDPNKAGSCVNVLMYKPEENIKKAVALAHSESGWKHWSTAAYCGIQ